jgi:hypothetical protein
MNQSATFWQALKHRVHWPTYMVTIDGDQGVGRTLLVKESCDFLGFVQQAPLGRITSVSLLLSPTFPEVDVWEAVPVRYVDRLPPNANLPFPTPMLTSHEGQLFGGFPIAALRSLPRGEPVRIAEFRQYRLCAAPCTTCAHCKDVDADERQRRHC